MLSDETFWNPTQPVGLSRFFRDNSREKANTCHSTSHHVCFFPWMQGEFVYLRHQRHAFLQPSGRGKMSTLDVSAIKEKYKYKTGRNVECLHVLSAFCFFHKHTLPAVTPATELGLLTPPLIHRDGKKTGNRQPQWMELQNTYLYQPAAETPD